MPVCGERTFYFIILESYHLNLSGQLRLPNVHIVSSLIIKMSGLISKRTLNGKYTMTIKYIFLFKGWVYYIVWGSEESFIAVLFVFQTRWDFAL